MARAAVVRSVDFADQAAEHFNDPAMEGKLFIPNAIDGMARGNNFASHYRSIEEAFPTVDPGLKPLGNLVLVQLRIATKLSGGGIIVDTESRRTEQDNTQVAKVIAFGPLAFRNRNTGDLWPEGAWCAVGDYVRVPKYQGDRFIKSYELPETKRDLVKGWVETGQMVRDEVEFVLFKDLALLGVFTDDPLSIRAHL